jgi:hypothetical protein
MQVPAVRGLPVPATHHGKHLSDARRTGLTERKTVRRQPVTDGL